MMDRKLQIPVIGRDLYSKMILEKPDLDTLTTGDNPSYNGFVYEFVSSLLISVKIIGYYDKVYWYDSSLKRGNVTDKWVPLESFSQLLDNPIYTGGDGGVDIMTKKDGIRHFYQVKHSQNISFEDTGIRKMRDHFECQDENISLIINDKIKKPNDKKDKETLKKIKIHKKKGYSRIFENILSKITRP